jgi:S-adenosylmethionine-diacylglycerol 3-amino-3-carboxypropyl transferase
MTAIDARASFEAIRYAQVWEDADVLATALAPAKGGNVLSICSAGDNTLAMLLLDPAGVHAADFSRAQVACLLIRMECYRRLDHGAFLELIGSRPSTRRGELLDAVSAGLGHHDRGFWAARRDEVILHGLGGVGKFERYFRIFRTRILPLVHSRRTVDAVFEPRAQDDRREFLDRTWNSWRWRLLLKGFFSRFAMGRLGRDPAFFEHVEGSVSDHVAKRIGEAFVGQDPSRNPYLHWLMLGTHGKALPLALRAESFDVIRDRLDRVTWSTGSVIDAAREGRWDGFNLSDVFEYMAPAEFEANYAAILEGARPGARIAYWNMMAPRSRPDALAGRVACLPDLSASLHREDKAFFYSAFRVDEVRA